MFIVPLGQLSALILQEQRKVLLLARAQRRGLAS